MGHYSCMYSVGRLESVQGFCLALEPAVRKFMTFIKGIPGFALLNMHDQVSVVVSEYLQRLIHWVLVISEENLHYIFIF